MPNKILTTNNDIYNFIQDVNYGIKNTEIHHIANYNKWID